MRQQVLLGDEHRATQASPSRDDRYFVNRHGAIIQDALHQGMASFVVSGQFLLIVIHQSPVLTTELHLLARIVDIDHFYFFLSRLAASSAASLSKFANSAPESPGVPRAITARSIASTRLIFFA